MKSSPPSSQEITQVREPEPFARPWFTSSITAAVTAALATCPAESFAAAPGPLPGAELPPGACDALELS